MIYIIVIIIYKLLLGDIGFLSDVIPSKGIIFRKTSPAYNYSWHTAPCRQFVVNLNADVEITASDGETKVIKQGNVFFLEDTHGNACTMIKGSSNH